MPVSGITRVTPPMMTNVCTPRIVARPAANSFENGRSAWTAMRNPLPTSSRKHDDARATVPSRPSSSPMAAKMKSVDATGIMSGLPSPRPVPAKPPVPNAYRPARAGSPRSRRSATGRATCRRGPARGRTAGTRRTAPATNSTSAGDEVRGAVGRDVEHRHEHGEEQQRRAEVLLRTMHEDRDAPGEQQRAEVLRVGQVQPADAAAARREQLALLDQVGGEEHDQQHLRRLAGLEVERAERDPQAGAVDLTADAGNAAAGAARRRRGAGTCSGSARGCGRRGRGAA